MQARSKRTVASQTRAFGESQLAARHARIFVGELVTADSTPLRVVLDLQASLERFARLAAALLAVVHARALALAHDILVH